MSNVSRVSRIADHPAQLDSGQLAKIADKIRALLDTLPHSEQERVLCDLTNTLHSIPVPRGGEVLATIVRLLPRDQEWTVEDVKKKIAIEGVQAANKEIYNALGYLVRRGHIKRIGYGRYLVNGAEVVTSDDLGGEPTRYEGD